MFEFTLGEALQKGATTVVAGAAVQSNYCRQLAAACSKLGLGLHLVLRRTPGEGDTEIQGNLLLDLLFSAEIKIIEADVVEQKKVTEGILLGPVYTGKAVAALIDYIRRKEIGNQETVVFLHTGGFPALFAYNKGLNLEGKIPM